MNKKHKLIVLSNWTYPLEKSWSGTTFSLTKALGKYYDVEIKNLEIGNWMNKLYRLSHLPILGQIFGTIYDILLQLKASKIVGKNTSVPVFEISNVVKLKNPYFTYQDLTYHVAMNVKEWKRDYPFIFQAAGNNIISEGEICRRKKRQHNEYRQAKAVFYMSHWVKDIMDESYNDVASKMVHIGGGTNIDVNRINVSKKTGNKFLFIGRDFERKAGDLVLEAFKILKSQYMPNAELHMAGCLPQENTEGIFFYGDVDYLKVSDLLNLCDVFCMPSRFEAYGLVFVEALIYGLPCIGRAFFEMPYFIKEGKDGALIIDDNPDILARKMLEVISNKEMIKDIQLRRAEYIEEYSWDSVAKRAKKIIDKYII